MSWNHVLLLLVIIKSLGTIDDVGGGEQQKHSTFVCGGGLVGQWSNCVDLNFDLQNTQDALFSSIHL